MMAVQIFPQSELASVGVLADVGKRMRSGSPPILGAEAANLKVPGAGCSGARVRSGSPAISVARAGCSGAGCSGARVRSGSPAISVARAGCSGARVLGCWVLGQ